MFFDRKVVIIIRNSPYIAPWVHSSIRKVLVSIHLQVAGIIVERLCYQILTVIVIKSIDLHMPTYSILWGSSILYSVSVLPISVLQFLVNFRIIFYRFIYFSAACLHSFNHWWHKTCNKGWFLNFLIFLLMFPLLIKAFKLFLPFPLNLDYHSGTSSSSERPCYG